MGQQQLLLLVLGIVIVGLSVIGAIGSFSEKKTDSDYDMLTAEATKIASEIIAWKSYPSALGGGKDVVYLTGLTFAGMGYETTNNSGSKAHNDLYFRTLSKTDTSRPIIILRSRNNPNLRVQTYLYGPSEDCFRVRRSQKVDGSWVKASMSVGVKAVPEGCSGW